MTNPGNWVAKVVDITGDTVVEVTIPYLNQTPWLDVEPTSPQEAGIIAMYLLNPIVSGTPGVNAIVYYNVWHSGAEDMRFSMARTPPRAPQITQQSPGKEEVYLEYPVRIAPGEDFEAQMQDDRPDLYPISYFQRTFPALLPAEIVVEDRANMGEQANNLIDCIRRYQGPFGYAAPVGTLSPIDFIHDKLGFGSAQTGSTIGATAEYWTWTWIWYTFKFHRGSLRYKCFNYAAASATPLAYGYDWRVGLYTNPSTPILTGSDGIVVTSRAHELAEIEVPFFYQNYFYVSNPVGQPRPPAICKDNAVHTATDWRYYVAAGEDWSFGWCASPPTQTTAALKPSPPKKPAKGYLGSPAL